MDNHTQSIKPMPRPDFSGMTDRKLNAYLKSNKAYVSLDDKSGTRVELLETAALAADRKAEDFLAARAQAATLNAAVTRTSDALQVFPRGDLGLTPDDVKASPEWKSAQRGFTASFQALRKFNSSYTKAFADELRHERNIRRTNMLASA